MQDLRGLSHWPKMTTQRTTQWYRGRGAPHGLPTLIVGAGNAARTLTRDLRRTSSYGLLPVGCLDDNPFARPVLGLPVLGRLADLCQVVTERRIDVVIIAIPSLPAAQVRALAREAAATGARVRYLPSFLAAVENVARASDLRMLQLGALLGRKLGRQ